MRFPVLTFLLAWLAACSRLEGADPRPVVGPGASRDEVIEAYGWPTGFSKAGVKEILNYPQGKVMLENGRVERVDFSTAQPWPAPRPRPGPATATTARKTDAPVDFWLGNFDDGLAEAVRRRARVLILFTGPDWSPASKQFREEVEFNAEFVNALTGDFVFVRLEFSTRSTLPPDVRDQNNRLRERFGVTTYPALLVVSAAGAADAAVDFSNLPAGPTFCARVVAAVADIRRLLVSRPPAAAPAPAAENQPAPALEHRGAEPVTSAAVTSGLSSARWLVTSAIVAGVLLAGGMFWLVWRNWAARPEASRDYSMASRISDAAGGLPSRPELANWTKERVASLVAALAEVDGYVAEVQPPGAGKDVVLKRAGEARPRVIVDCASGRAGATTAKRLRELLGTLAAEGVDVGWFVSPAGFTADARTFGNQHNLLLIDADRLIVQLRDLPPLLVPKVIARI